LDFIYEIFSNLPRQGPGDNVSTRKAFAFLTDLPPNPSILDVGCGTGMQTLELAKLIKGTIIALDNHQPFLDVLSQNAKKLGLGKQITLLNQSMLTMQFDDESFDIIWCEGAVFVYGMERALHDWKKFIKQSGYLVFSELCWLKGNIPQELADFFKQEYPAMTTLEKNKKTIESQGYILLAHFTIPEESWWSPYYSPLEPNLVKLKKKYHNDKEKIAQLDQVSLEISMYRKYPTYYGNVFFILKKK
jgi:ubiquinone/menaquinone biosynthesis C-methylase UbiE